MSKEEFIEKVKPLTYEEWKAVIDKNFPKISDIVEALLSVSVLLWFEDVDLPFALVLIGPPAGYKTTALSMCDEHYNNIFYYTDHFTPKSFVTHIADRKKREELEKIDLLPRIENKILIVPELATIFGQSDDELLESMSILVRVLDGKGYTSDSGAHGRRGYKKPVKFMWLAASTPLPYRVWNIMGNLGTKLYFLRMPDMEQKEDLLAEMLAESDYKIRVEKCADATSRFLVYLKPKNEKIEWNKREDPRPTRLMIVKLAKLLARLRGAVNVHAREEITEDGTKEVINYTTPLIEVPDRAAISLYNLARGHAYIQGRNQISEADLPLSIEVVLSSAPQDRVSAFRALLENGGELTTTELMQKIGCSRNTAIRTMNTLEILNLVNKEETTINYATGFKVILHLDLKWCLDDKFFALWGVKKQVKQETPKKEYPMQFFGGRGRDTPNE